MSRLPLFRRFARRDGAEIFNILQGFVASQVLVALIDLGLLPRLLAGSARVEELSRFAKVPADRMDALLRAGVALKLLKLHRDGRYGLARRGAAILGVPGLESMILHNAAFYADLSDPVALLRKPGSTELSRFWPYVMQNVSVEGGVARRYSDLMAQSQALVAADTVRQVSLRGVDCLMDVGGGTGAFLTVALKRYPSLRGILFDLPEVLSGAEELLIGADVRDRVQLCSGSFRGEMPHRSADAISLVRVLYDHGDDTVRHLLGECFEALPPGGRLLVSEPMSGGRRPDPITDLYFSFYTMAMGEGRVRSQAEIAEMCEAAGFAVRGAPKPLRSYVTSVVVCEKPA